MPWCSPKITGEGLYTVLLHSTNAVEQNLMFSYSDSALCPGFFLGYFSMELLLSTRVL